MPTMRIRPPRLSLGWRGISSASSSMTIPMQDRMRHCDKRWIMDAKGLDKSHNDAVREISARVLAQLHQLAKRGRIQRIGRRVGVSWVMPPV
jgi:hypothetical protein